MHVTPRGPALLWVEEQSLDSIVVRGNALVTKADEQFVLKEDSSTYISAGIAHRLENPGKIPLELIEVQTGGYIGEDDITRLEDIYGRHR